MRRVKLTDKDGKSAVVRIGARQKLSNKTYVQKEGDDTIYLVDADLNRQMKKSLSDYRGKQLAQFAQTDAVRVEVTGERQYTLVKTDNKWVIESPIKARAAQAAVNTLLTSLSNMRVREFVDDAPKSLRVYGLEPPRFVVSVTTEKKTPKPVSEGTEGPVVPEFDVESQVFRVAFGATAEDKLFARLGEADSPAVFDVAKSLADQVAPELSVLRDKRVTEAATAKVQRVVFTREKASVTLVKTDGRWRIESGLGAEETQEAEFAAVDDLLKAVRDLKAVGFEFAPLPVFGLETPRATIELTAEGLLEPVRLRIGGLTPSKTGVYVKNERDGTIAVAAVDAVTPLLVTPESFLSRNLFRISRIWSRKIELSRGERSCTLEKNAGRWRFASPVTGVVDQPAMTAVESDLTALRGRRVVALADQAARYGLDKPAIRATLTSLTPPELPTTQPASRPTSQPTQEPPKPKPPIIDTLLVNRHTDGKVYAMVEGGRTICEVDAKVFDDLNAELLDTKVLPVEPSQVIGLAYGAENAFEFTKTGDRWSLKGEASFQIDVTKITGVLNALRDMRAMQYVRYKDAKPEAFGLDAPAVELTVWRESGDAVALKISAKGPPEGGRYAMVSSTAGRVFVVKPEDVDKLAKKVADFHKAG
ncbi:MAG: DUF4340 domain-containing protein [Phycisphaerae bacterium]